MGSRKHNAASIPIGQLLRPMRERLAILLDRHGGLEVETRLEPQRRPGLPKKGPLLWPLGALRWRRRWTMKSLKRDGMRIQWSAKCPRLCRLPRAA